jgi:hypothetical protein
MEQVEKLCEKCLDFKLMVVWASDAGEPCTSTYN